MLVIRMARTGRTKYPTYRIVAAESSRAATGRFVAGLGHYNPHTKELVLKREDIERHLSNGAQPSNSVIKLLNREGIELPKWAKLKTKAPKAAPVDETAVAETEEPAVEETAAETVVDEAPVEEERVATVAEDEATATADDAEATATQETAASEDAQAEEAVENEAAADASADEAEKTEAA